MNLNIFLTSILAGLFLGSGLTTGILNVYYTNQVKELTMQYEQAERVQYELNKACEAHRMYLTHVLDKHGIEYVH